MLVAPPYDVVKKSERDALVAADSFNIFSLELPDASQCGNNHGIDKYNCSKQLLDSWKAEKILEFDENPSFYPYEIEFALPSDTTGTRLVRRGIIVTLRTEEWSDRIVLPHEKTFDKVTDDRLKLLSATETQFSPIFMLYRPNVDASRIYDSFSRDRLFSTKDSAGNIHTLWKVDKKDELDAFSEALKDKPLYIADGHHRYTTSLRYRKEMEKINGPESVEKYGYIMAYLADVEDSGMVVLSTHRILSKGVADLEVAMPLVKKYFDILPVETGDQTPTSIATFMKKSLEDKGGRQAIGCIYNKGRNAEVWLVRDEGIKMLSGDNARDELSSLDVVVLNDIVFKQLGVDSHNLEAGKDIRYEADAEKAIASLQDEEIMFFMRPTPASKVLDVSDAGLVMPHKSTFFYPKILSGLVLNAMDNSCNL